MKTKSKWRTVVGVTAIIWVVLLFYANHKMSGIRTKDQPLCTGVKYRGVASKDYILPNNTVLDKADEDEVLEYYWKYINSHQLNCSNQARLGSSKDGGKIICLDNRYRPTKPCLVYSFGSNFNFDFELDVGERFNCEIHTFDPSHPIGDRKLPDILTFHMIGLHGNNTINSQGWKMMTLSSITKMLKHRDRVIDILKIDIEGGEWHSFPHMFKSEILKRVKQLSIELHFGRSKPANWQQFWGDVKPRDQLEMVRQLHYEGFRLFSREYVGYSSMLFKNPYGCITNQNEITLINIKYLK